ncbi:MAG: SpoIIE family protein phosphatase [Ignavibacteria bacterium]|nr:SpoIIE family protein phosphatase [Ignavibacteria bacterium]
MPENLTNQNSSIYKHNLETLIDYTLTINSFKDIDHIANHLLLTLMGKFLISRIALFIVNENEFSLVKSKGIIVDSEFSKIEINEKGISDNPKVLELLELYNLKHIKELRLNEKLLGIIFYQFHNSKSNLTKEESDLFESIISLTAVVIENVMMINRLDAANRKLQQKISQTRSLFELSKEFSLLLNESDVYKFLSYTVMGNFMITRFALIGIDGNKKEIIGSNFENEKLLNLIEKLSYEAISLIITKENTQLIDSTQELGISLIIPLEIKNKITGLMICGDRLTKTPFTEDEIEFLQSLGSIAAISLENIKLFREMIEKQKIEEDIRIAREIQKNLFPKSFPQSNAFELFGMNLPSKKVGGDYFDCFRISDDKLLILISDVVGKGIPASLIMSNLQAMIKTIASKNFEIKEATQDINNLMKKNLTTGNFITFFWGILDEQKRTLEYVNAGHNPPFLIRQNHIKKLDKGGIILGILEALSPYESEIVKLQTGDLICLYTDGFIEATDQNENEFSEERFIESLIKYNNYPPEIITNKLIDDVLTFSSNKSELDDLTILLIKVK